MIISRTIFYDTMRKTNSPNLAYVEEIKGFSKSKSETINLLEILKRLDSFDIMYLMFSSGDQDMANFVKKMWISHEPDSPVAAGLEGFDCWLPPQVRRDCLIKLYYRTRDIDQIKSIIHDADYETYFREHVLKVNSV